MAVDQHREVAAPTPLAARRNAARRGALGRTLSLLDADPDLADGLDERERWRARRYLVVRATRIASGPAALAPEHPRGLFGVLILDGLLGVQLRLRGRLHLELLGDGELLQPWVGVGGSDLGDGIDWWAFRTSEVALLDEAFVARAAHWPAVLANLATRLITRQRRLLFQTALSSLVSVDERLLLLLWHLADRWGHVTPDGVRIHLPLTHERLAAMVGARRPSVTSAIGRLRAGGALEMPHPQTYLLCGTAPPELDMLTSGALASA